MEHTIVPNVLRRDPLTGRSVVITPGRARRPGVNIHMDGMNVADDPASCPFCEGHEERTPPEELAIPSRERDADTPGWRVRVVPNLFPAFERQHVVVHTPRHVRSLANLDRAELRAVAEAWKAMIDGARSEGFAYVHLLVNEGRLAGASLPHTHSQLVWFRELPPALRREEERLVAGSCALCALLEDGEESDGRTIAERDGLVLQTAFAGRFPYEMTVAPREHAPDALASIEQLESALCLLAEGIRRLYDAERGAVPLNIWLHTFPGDGHWHFELVPRLTVLAGVELGADIFLNTLAPDEAASRLREASGERS